MTIFISHHSSKIQIAEHLAQYLERKGFTCWVAPRDIPAGSQWDVAITQAIEGASALILLFCGQADQSVHVKREISIAENSSVTVYPIRLENIAPDRLGYFLQTSQWIDWIDQRDETLEQLIYALRAGLSSSSQPSVFVGEERGDNPSFQQQMIDDYSWPKKIVACKTDDLAHELAGRSIFQSCSMTFEDSVILPTGRTASLLFRGMLKSCADYPEDPFNGAPILTDTETFGVHPKHSTSRTMFVKKMLVDKLKKMGKKFPEENFHPMPGLVLEDDPFQKVRDFLRFHPPAVHAVAVAPSGEVIGYEIATYTDPDLLAADRCRVIEVSESGKRYIDEAQPSRSIVTVGMSVPLAARNLIIPIFDINKVGVFKRLVLLSEDPAIPASILRRHLNCYIITTQRVVDEAKIVPSDIIQNRAEMLEFIDKMD